MPKFVQIIRVFFTDTFHNSVQYYNPSDYESWDVMMVAVNARYHNILAADLQNADCTYNAAYIIDSTGRMYTKDVFDRMVETEQPSETEGASEE